MNPKYSAAAEEIYLSLERTVRALREELKKQSAAVEKIPEETMMLELAAHVLIQGLIRERLALDARTDETEAAKEALAIVRKAVARYRSTAIGHLTRH